jgi:hypothetical protein
MTETEALIARARTDVLPLPIVVDADVLHRNIDYCLRTGWTPRLIDSASHGYTLLTGVVLFATARVQEEIERQLDEIAIRREVPREDVAHVWNETFLPRIRFVEIQDGAVADPRVEQVRALHEADAPTAALAVMLSPCVVLTDNRKHFAPLGIPDIQTDRIAVDARELSRYYGSANAMTIVPTLTGAMAIEGSKKMISTIGRDASILIALLLIGAAVVIWRSEPGGQIRASAKKLAREVGPSLAQVATRALVLSEEMSALAIDAPAPPDSAIRFLAKILATRQTIMSTAEIGRRLHEHGYRFIGTGVYATRVRGWLTSQDCFCETQRGHWTLGYQAEPL